MVSEINSSKRAEIKNKSVIGLPNTVTGKPDTVKNAIFDPLDIVVGEINRVVEQINRVVEQINNELSINDTEHNAEIDKVKALAEANKFVVETIYDKSSSSSSLNHGFPNGLFKGNRINGLNLSKYRYLIINCQDDRTMTMFMDLTEKNYLNNFYINSMSGTKENNKNFATISFEVIINLNKTYFHLNNAVCSSGFSVTKELVTSTLLNISKVTGII